VGGAAKCTHCRGSGCPRRCGIAVGAAATARRAWRRRGAASSDTIAAVPLMRHRPAGARLRRRGPRRMLRLRRRRVRGVRAVCARHAATGGAATRRAPGAAGVGTAFSLRCMWLWLCGARDGGGSSCACRAAGRGCAPRRRQARDGGGEAQTARGARERRTRGTDPSHTPRMRADPLFRSGADASKPPQRVPPPPPPRWPRDGRRRR
jgi:hypothetical protein